MDEVIKNILENKDVSRLFCLAIAAEAKKTGVEELDYKTLSNAFRDIVKSLDRMSYHTECRLLSRLGPERYLQQVTRKFNALG